jgi:hypothetical protein
VSWFKRLRLHLGWCPYCGLRGPELRGHLEWAHASKRNEWLPVYRGANEESTRG